MNKYQSATTPGLIEPFAQYLAELVCLNMEPMLTARFWGDGGYWKNKYARECRGFSKLAKLYRDDIEDPLRQQAIIGAVKLLRVQSLLREETLLKLDARVAIDFKILSEQRDRLATQVAQPKIDHDEYMKRNSKLTPVIGGGRLARLRQIEGKSGKAKDDSDSGEDGKGQGQADTLF